jgi:hypothetical protein
VGRQPSARRKRTAVLLHAKCGQSPVDPGTLHTLAASGKPRLPAGHADVTDPADLLGNGGILVAQETADDVSLLWLKDSSQIKRALAILEAGRQSTNSARIQKVHAGIEPLSQPRLKPARVSEPVANKQVAPTILHLRGLKPEALQAVRLEGMKVLPGYDSDDERR